MQAQLLVGPITPTTGSDAFSSIIKNSFLISSPRRSTTGSNRHRRTRHRLVVASSSWSSSAAAGHKRRAGPLQSSGRRSKCHAS
ncbi:hypothetical protein CUMW_048180 [Citrus unshiu]|nr:hypothetical protein CUMW_048180 [Citrus unshiu]